jgi:rubrerythrin
MIPATPLADHDSTNTKQQAARDTRHPALLPPAQAPGPATLARIRAERSASLGRDPVELRCCLCGYGITVHVAPDRCPMCGGSGWDQAPRRDGGW